MIKIKNGKKSFGHLNVFKNLNLVIDKPGLYFMQGESGSGKSTLLNLLAGFDKFDSGEVTIHSNIATIFQNYELIPSMTIEENIYLKIDPDITDDIELFEELGIVSLMKNYPNELSGGQKQRVGIARALLLNPNIILCDEPTESLDIENKQIVMHLLEKLALHKIVLVASHDQQMVDEYAQHVFYLEDKGIEARSEYITSNKFEIAEKKKFTSKEIKNFIHKIVFKRTLLLSLVLIILTSILQGLFIYDKKIFYIPNTTNALNADMVYLNILSDKNVLEISDLEPILNFSTMELNGRNYALNIYPYVENVNNLEIEGNLPKGNGIIVNKNLIEELQIKNWEGYVLDLTYRLGSSEYGVEVKIVGVIDESDTVGLNIYYHLEDILNHIDSSMTDTGLTHKEYIQFMGKHYQKKVGYKVIEGFYNSKGKEDGVFLVSPLYDERTEINDSLQVFGFIFKSIEISLMVLIVIYVVISMNSDTKSYLKTCSILVSQGMDLNVLKKQYVIEKTKLLIPGLVLSNIVILAISYIWLKNILLISDYIIIEGVPLVVFAVSLMTLLIGIKQIKIDKIANILKNDN